MNLFEYPPSYPGQLRDPRCASSSSRVSDHLTPRPSQSNSSSRLLSFVFISRGPSQRTSQLLPVSSPLPFSILLCLTILISHNPSCLNIHDGLRAGMRIPVYVHGPRCPHTMGPDCGLGIRRQSRASSYDTWQINEAGLRLLEYTPVCYYSTYVATRKLINFSV